MKKKPAAEESGEKAPLWIISFADMISLLMAFFVMLQTLAAEQSNEFLSSGREKLRATAFEFRRNIDGFGLPGLFGSPGYSQHMQSAQRKFKLESEDTQVINPAIDGEAEKLQRLFKRLSEMSDVNMSPFRDNDQVFECCPIMFEEGQTELNEEAKRYLKNYAGLLEQTTDLGRATICIVGIGGDFGTEPEQWRGSEVRARTVARFLQSMLPEQCRDNVFWWGAGPMMDGVTAGQKPFILISIDDQ